MKDDRNYDYTGMPLCFHGVLKTQLIEVSKILKKLGVTYWLEWGTLLGAVRNKKIIPWDYDNDLGFLVCDIEKIMNYNIEINKNGYEFWTTSSGNVIRFNEIGKRKIHTDLFAFKKINNEYRVAYKEILKKSHIRPVDELFPLGKIELEGNLYPCPNEYMKIIKRRFGENWWVKEVSAECFDYIKNLDPENTDILNEIKNNE